MILPLDLESASESAWAKASQVPGYIGHREFKALGMLLLGAPRNGAAVEIGSFKGRSTVGLATLAARYQLGSIVSIDPHDAPCSTDPDLQGASSSFDDFRSALRSAGVEEQVEVHRALSQDVAHNWNRPIRFLWIDGDHTYKGAKLDFDAFHPHLIEGGIVAIHDTLHEFEGPLRVFVEEILASDKFGPSGLLHTISWAQYRPHDGAKFAHQRNRLARRARKLIPLVQGGRRLDRVSRILWKLGCATVPHRILSPAEFERVLTS
jgi:predicted O-methyltransferase YrrM